MVKNRAVLPYVEERGCSSYLLGVKIEDQGCHFTSTATFNSKNVVLRLRELGS